MFRSEKLRRKIAQMSCMNCGLEGSTQAAHANLRDFGKGMGLKASDGALMALCIGCHAELDQGRSMDKEQKRAFQMEMIAKTLVKAIECGDLEVAK